MKQHRPRGCDGRTWCPYSAWRGGSPRPASIEKLGPYERTGEPRFRCKFCNAAFLEPSHLGSSRKPFGRYRVDEALVAHLAHDEMMADAARRLGVTPRTAYRWLAAARKQGLRRNDRRMLSLDHEVGFPDARWFRRVGNVKDAPYAVDGEDLLAYHCAAIGEVGFLLTRERIVNEDRLRKWQAVASDAFVKPATRQSAIDEARRTLFKARKNLRKRDRGQR